jgi:hypothetical protein
MPNEKYIDNDIDDDIDDNIDDNIKVKGESNNDQDMEKLLSALGGIDESTLNKLKSMAEMKDMTDLKKMRKMFSKMNLDKNKLKSMADKMQHSEVENKDSTQLTRDELRKKLREKTQLMRKTRIMK